jgi:hypothetical protein
LESPSSQPSLAARPRLACASSSVAPLASASTATEVYPDSQLRKEVTYDVLRVFKGTIPSTIGVWQLVPLGASPVSDEQARLRPEVFGEGHTLLVFARLDGEKEEGPRMIMGEQVPGPG